MGWYGDNGGDLRTASIIYAKTIAENLSGNAVSWAKREMEADGVAGAVLASAYNIDSAAMRACGTFTEIVNNSATCSALLANSAAKAMVFGDSTYQSILFNSAVGTKTVFDTAAYAQEVYINESIIRTICQSPTGLSGVMKSAYAHCFNQSAYVGASYYRNDALFTCRNNPAYFRRKPMTGYAVLNGDSTAWWHDLQSNSWGTGKNTSQNAIYFVHCVKVYSGSGAAAYMYGYGRGASGNGLTLANVISPDYTVINRLACGTLGGVRLYTPDSWPAAENSYGELFEAI